MDIIRISIQEVEETSAKIRAISESLNEILEDIRQEMSMLESVWMSEASQTMKERFAGFSSRFPIYKEVVDSYAGFLQTTAQTYANVEASINSNASMLQ